MSTRTQIIIKDSFGSELWFYRHSDGYPEGTMPTLQKFMDLVKRGKIRDNAEQASGWLVLIGAIEYQTLHNNLFSEAGKASYERDHTVVETILDNFEPIDWKCGAYEPSVPEQHGDIEYLYTIDLAEKTVTYKEV
jgi:hypothetical protein